ncbi:MAG: hypothetical protein AAF125_01585 [Chloroflexota bacterium]
MRKIWLIVLVMLAVGCTSARNDVRLLLDGEGINALAMDCRSPGSTRTVYCTTSLTPEQKIAIVDAFGLEATATPPINDFQEGCDDLSAFGPEASGIEVDYLGERASVLRSPNGTQFEYMVLYYDPETLNGCLQLDYAFG